MNPRPELGTCVEDDLALLILLVLQTWTPHTQLTHYRAGAQSSVPAR